MLAGTGWLAAGVDALQHAEAASGRTVVPLHPDPTDHERDVAGLSSAEFITANCFCRRSSLEAVGGFDERFTAAWREDSDLHFSLIERGFTIKRAENAIVVHPYRKHLGGSVCCDSGEGSLILFSIASILIFISRAHPPAAKVFTTRARRRSSWRLFGSYNPRPELSVGGGLVWVALTFQFAARRLRGASRSADTLAEMLVTSALIPLLSIYWLFSRQLALSNVLLVSPAYREGAKPWRFRRNWETCWTV